MRIGCARVSTLDQTTQPQGDVLTAAGCERVLTEIVPGAAVSRSVLERLRRELALGNVVVVVRLTVHMMGTLAELERALIVECIPTPASLPGASAGSRWAGPVDLTVVAVRPA